jgi:hypothetical protein
MRQDEPANAGFLCDLSTLTRVEMNRIGLARGKRAVQYSKIGIATEPNEVVAIL